MKDREYLNCGVYQSIDHNVRSARDHQLASAVNSAGTALPGKPAETLDGFEEQIELPVRCCDAVFRDIAVDFPSFRFGQGCPLDLYGRMQKAYLVFFFGFRAGSGFKSRRRT